MKKRNFLVYVLLLIAILSNAQKKGGNIDQDKNTIDAKAKVNLGKVKSEIGVRYDIDDKKFEILSGKFEMSAGDIVIAAEIRKRNGKDIEEIASIYQKNKNKGWGVLAKELGIKPGSAEFHQLKAGVHDFAYDFPTTTKVKKAKPNKKPKKK